MKLHFHLDMNTILNMNIYIDVDEGVCILLECACVNAAEIKHTHTHTRARAHTHTHTQPERASVHMALKEPKEQNWPREMVTYSPPPTLFFLTFLYLSPLSLSHSISLLSHSSTLSHGIISHDSFLARAAFSNMHTQHIFPSLPPSYHQFLPPSVIEP